MLARVGRTEVIKLKSRDRSLVKLLIEIAAIPNKKEIMQQHPTLAHCIAFQKLKDARNNAQITALQADVSEDGPSPEKRKSLFGDSAVTRKPPKVKRDPEPIDDQMITVHIGDVQIQMRAPIKKNDDPVISFDEESIQTAIALLSEGLTANELMAKRNYNPTAKGTYAYENWQGKKYMYHKSKDSDGSGAIFTRKASDDNLVEEGGESEFAEEDHEVHPDDDMNNLPLA